MSGFKGPYAIEYITKDTQQIDGWFLRHPEHQKLVEEMETRIQVAHAKGKPEFEDIGPFSLAALLLRDYKYDVFEKYATKSEVEEFMRKEPAAPAASRLCVGM